jgi:hypothetical protein
MTCKPGAWGCACYANYTCDAPYSCSSGTCVYANTSTGGATSCPTGERGCPCYPSGVCASPYTCSNGYCYLTGSGGAPPFGGTTSVSYGGSFPSGGTRSTGLGGQVSSGGRTTSVGGTASVVACTQSLQACMADSGCSGMLDCLLKYSSVCNTDVNCYALQCASSITGESAALAIKLFQDCSGLLNM